MSIKRSLLRRLGQRTPVREAPPKDWRHPKWPARSVDRLVVSFPKSGRTWLRVLLGAVEAHRAGRPVQDEVATWLDRDQPLLAGSPVLFTHALSEEPREPERHLDLFQAYVGEKRRLFLVRDPRDVVVSYFYQRVKRENRPDDLPLELSSFVRSPGYGIERICRFLAACARALEHEAGPACLLSYEDLHADPERALARVLAFFGAGDTDRAAIAQAVEYGRFENMRRLERANALAGATNKLAALDPDDPDTFKTRKGRVGSYREELSAGDQAFVEERVRALLPESMGYREPGRGPASRG